MKVIEEFNTEDGSLIECECGMKFYIHYGSPKECNCGIMYNIKIIVEEVQKRSFGEKVKK